MHFYYIKLIDLMQKTGDFFFFFLLTMDRDLEADYNGIRKINIIDWLLDTKN